VVTMGWFGLFKATPRKPKTASSSQEPYRPVDALSQVKARLRDLDAQMGTLHLVLRRHDEEIAACRDLADRQGQTLARLEEIVNTPPVPPAGHAARPPVPAAGPHLPQLPLAGVESPGYTPAWNPARYLDIDRFSEQQKRLLAVFLQNPDRPMSYADVADELGKSAHTVKNQMHLIRGKADLFDSMVGPQNRLFFRLKDNLKLEKHLKAGRCFGWPVPTASCASLDRSADAPGTGAASSERTLASKQA